MNADPVVMEFFPSTLTKSESDAFVDRIEHHFESEGFGLWAVEIESTRAFVGYVGLWPATLDAHFTPAVNQPSRRVMVKPGMRTESADEFASPETTNDHDERSSRRS